MTLPGVSFEGNMAHFTLTDGELGDDSMEDGKILDQGGPAIGTVGAPATNAAGLAAAVLSLIGVAYWSLLRARAAFARRSL